MRKEQISLVVILLVVIWLVVILLVVILLAVQTVRSWAPTKLRSRRPSN